MNIQGILQELSKQNKKIIAIDGPSASGKSTLASILKIKYDAVVIHTDDYFLPENQKTVEKLKIPGQNLDHNRLSTEVFQNIKQDKITINHFDCTKQKLFQKWTYDINRLIIIEGVYSLHPIYQKYYDYKIFLTVDKKTQKNRIIERNGQKMYEKFAKIWIPLENEYFSAFDIEKSADVKTNLEEFIAYLGDKHDIL